MKVSCTVWSGGKSGDEFKGLPITIRREVPGHEAAHGWRWRRRGRHGSRTPAVRPVHRLIAPAVKLS